MFFGGNITGNGQDLTLDSNTQIQVAGNIGTLLAPLGDIIVANATDADFYGTVDAATFTQNAGSGTTTFDDVIDFSGAFYFTGTNLTMNGVGTNVADVIDITQSGVFTLAEDANIEVTNVGGVFYSGGSGTFSIAGNITAYDYIQFGGDVQLAGADAVVLTVTTGGSGISLLFQGNITGSGQDLTLDSINNIEVFGSIGTSVNPLGDIIVVNAIDTIFGSGPTFGTVDAASFNQSAGSGTTTFTDLVNLTGAFDFTGQALSINGVGANVVGTTMDVTNAGLFTTAIGANLTVGNDFVQDGAGLNSIGGNIASTNDGISFLRGVTLTNGVTMTTGAGAGDDIFFGDTLGGAAQSLILVAGAGDITFTGAVGGVTPAFATRLGAVTVTSANLVSALSTFSAASFTQSGATATGATTFAGLVNLTGAFDFTGQALSINGGGANVVGTTMDVTNAGLFTTANGANLTVGNEFVQDGAGLNSIGGNITSTADGITFATGVTLTNGGLGGVTMTTGLLADDDILFSSTLDGAAAGAQDLTLVAGAGNITFTGAVGGVTPAFATRLGDVTVTSADTVLASDTFAAASFTQIAGSGTTTFDELFDFTNQFDFTGNNLTVNGEGDNNVGEYMDINNDGTFTTNVDANLVVGEQFDQFGDGSNSIGGDITTGRFIYFETDVELTNGVTMTSAEDITFESTIDSAVLSTQFLTVVAADNAIFNGNIGSVTALGTLTVDCGNDFGETITFGTAAATVRAVAVKLNTNTLLTTPATVATIVASNNITFSNDTFEMGQNEKLTSLGGIRINGLASLTSNATSVTLGDVNAVGNLRVTSPSITLLARASGPIITNTGGTITDPMVDYVVSGQVFFSTAPVMGGSGGRATFSNPTGNVDGSGTLGNFAKTVYGVPITAPLLTGLTGQILDLSSTGSGPGPNPAVSYINPAMIIPQAMPSLPSIGLLGDSDTLDDDSDTEATNDQSKDGGKSADKSKAPAVVPVASR